MSRAVRSVRWARWGRIMGLVIFSSMASFAAKQSSVVAPNAVVKKLATGFRFVEGPVTDAKGNVYFSDIPNQRIHKWSLDGKVSLHRENSGGANGLFFDHHGNLIACEGGSRQLTSEDMKGNITILAKSYDGKKLNSPNDLWVDPQGGIYFTDPRYGRMDGLEQDGMHVYYLSPNRKKLIRVCNDLERPNGLIGTPDGKTLYIADHGGSKTWVYTIRPDGRLANKKLFVERGSDGMTMDEKGNIYLTDKSVFVYDPSGQLIEEIKVPEAPANLTFAGKDGRMLFITARTSIYALEMSVRGASVENWKRKD